MGYYYMQIKTLEQKLGRVYTAKTLSAYLGVAEGTVKKYYRELGGMRLGRRVLFFENRIERMVLYADLPQEEKSLAGQRQEGRDEKAEDLPDQDRSSGMGSRSKKITKKGLHSRDHYNLLT